MEIFGELLPLLSGMESLSDATVKAILSCNLLEITQFCANNDPLEMLESITSLLYLLARLSPEVSAELVRCSAFSSIIDRFSQNAIDDRVFYSFLRLAISVISSDASSIKLIIQSKLPYFLLATIGTSTDLQTLELSVVLMNSILEDHGLDCDIQFITKVCESFISVILRYCEFCESLKLLSLVCDGLIILSKTHNGMQALSETMAPTSLSRLIGCFQSGLLSPIFHVLSEILKSSCGMFTQSILETIDLSFMYSCLEDLSVSEPICDLFISFLAFDRCSLCQIELPDLINSLTFIACNGSAGARRSSLFLLEDLSETEDILCNMSPQLADDLSSIIEDIIQMDNRDGKLKLLAQKISGAGRI